jgi:hypothetical protein
LTSLTGISRVVGPELAHVPFAAPAGLPKARQAVSRMITFSSVRPETDRQRVGRSCWRSTARRPEGEP